MSGAWDAIEAASEERIVIEVPEWKCTVYALPCSIEDEAKVHRNVKDAESPETWAQIVWRKAQDENGKRLFDGVDFGIFKRKVQSSVCRRVGMAIFLGTQTVEEAEGN